MMQRIPIDTYKKGLRRRYLDLRDEWQNDISSSPVPDVDHPALIEMKAIRIIARRHGWIDEVNEEVTE